MSCRDEVQDHGDSDSSSHSPARMGQPLCQPHGRALVAVLAQPLNAKTAVTHQHRWGEEEEEGMYQSLDTFPSCFPLCFTRWEVEINTWFSFPHCTYFLLHVSYTSLRGSGVWTLFSAAVELRGFLSLARDSLPQLGSCQSLLNAVIG